MPSLPSPYITDLCVCVYLIVYVSEYVCMCECVCTCRGSDNDPMYDANRHNGVTVSVQDCDRRYEGGFEFQNE